MNSLLRDFQTLVLITAIVSCIPYGIWILITATNKRWKRVGIMLAAPVAAFLFLWALSASRGLRVFPDYYANLFDTEVGVGSQLYEFNSGRSGLGDGYSISVYELPDEVRNRFGSADNRLLTQFPRRPFYCLDWEYARWREAPTDPSSEKLADFALSDTFSREANGLSREFDAIRSALDRRGTYYACFYHAPNGVTRDIYFYVVDMVGGRMYLINQNT